MSCTFVFPQEIQRCNKAIVLCPSSVRFRSLSGWVFVFDFDVSCWFYCNFCNGHRPEAVVKHAHTGETMSKGLLFCCCCFFTMDISNISLKKNPVILVYPSALKKKLVFNINGNFGEIFLRSWHLWFKILTSKLFLKMTKHSSTRNEFTITWGVSAKNYTRKDVRKFHS